MGYVYFVRPIGKRDATKIGYTRDPATRLPLLQTWVPYPLEVVLLIEGDRALEARLHSQFYADHSHQEWFGESEAIDAFIDLFPFLGRMLIDYEAPVLSLSARSWTKERRAEASKTQRESWANRKRREEAA